jgi:hypothetical protein
MQTPAVKAGVRALWFRMAETLFTICRKNIKITMPAPELLFLSQCFLFGTGLFGE